MVSESIGEPTKVTCPYSLLLTLDSQIKTKCITFENSTHGLTAWN